MSSFNHVIPLEHRQNDQTTMGASGSTFERVEDEQNTHYDFIGPASTVKKLFAATLSLSEDTNRGVSSLPSSVNVAIHNMGNGALLVDDAVSPDMFYSLFGKNSGASRRQDEKSTTGEAANGSSEGGICNVDQSRAEISEIENWIKSEANDWSVVKKKERQSNNLRRPLVRQRTDRKVPRHTNRDSSTIMPSDSAPESYLLETLPLPSKSTELSGSDHGCSANQPASLMTDVSNSNTTAISNMFPDLSKLFTASSGTSAQSSTNGLMLNRDVPGRALISAAHIDRGVTQNEGEKDTSGGRINLGNICTAGLGPALPTPRQYLSWQFHDHKMLLASDAAIIGAKNTSRHDCFANSFDGNGGPVEGSSILMRHQRESEETNEIQPSGKSVFQSDCEPCDDSTKDSSFIPSPMDTSNSLVVRVEDTQQYSSSFSTNANLGFKSDDHHESVNVENKTTSPTYADVVCKLQMPSRKNISEEGQISNCSNVNERSSSCFIPASIEPSAAGTLTKVFSDPDFAACISSNFPMDSASESTPLYTCLDAYLENIMANVPQLALCLREKGLIHSAKLIRTEDIPVSMSATNSPRRESNMNLNDKGEPMFSASAVDLNAAMLMNFLKDNCTTENSTYLLRREIGNVQLQLIDVTSLSHHRQKKWTWWLAMMSYRFALRLAQHSRATPSAMRRIFRTRQRNLLKTSLDLLEELSDMDGGDHESIQAAIHEHLADTFLQYEDNHGPPDPSASPSNRTTSRSSEFFSLGSSFNVYKGITVDALEKAQYHVNQGILIIIKKFDSAKDDQSNGAGKPSTKGRTPNENTHIPSSNVHVVNVNSDSSDDDSDSEAKSKKVSSQKRNNKDAIKLSIEIEAFSIQLFRLYDKLANISFRLSEYHLQSYRSSSVMTELRLSARTMSEILSLLSILGLDTGTANNLSGFMMKRFTAQWSTLWNLCGHFSRSFGSDNNWRDRGHACGDDIVCLLQDVERCEWKQKKSKDSESLSSLFLTELITLRSLFGLTPKMVIEGHSLNSPYIEYNLDEINTFQNSEKYISAAKKLTTQKQIKYDQLRVCLAATLCYQKSIELCKFNGELNESNDPKVSRGPKATRNGNVLSDSFGNSMSSRTVICPKINDLRQCYGDVCNEIGKIFLSHVRELISQNDLQEGPTMIFYNSSSFFFHEGLRNFHITGNTSNIAIIRLNLSVLGKFNPGMSLQGAVDQLQMAHSILMERDNDPRTWDMVSEELAATLLILGVRRRKTLLGGGENPILAQAIRLTPGEECSVVECMEQSLKIYKALGNEKQTAAVHYQLALFYKRLWTCQRDVVRTREKLSLAFQHYFEAHQYFIQDVGSEPTFIILLLDLSNLYSAVSGEECLRKALGCCMDMHRPFSPESMNSALERNLLGVGDKDWIDKMKTLEPVVSDLLLGLIKSLVKFNKKKYEKLYRHALSAKLASSMKHDTKAFEQEQFEVFGVLDAVLKNASHLL